MLSIFFMCVFAVFASYLTSLQIQVHSDILSFFLEMSQHQLLHCYRSIYDTFQINYFYIVWIKGLSVIILHMLIQVFSAASVEKIILFIELP